MTDFAEIQRVAEEKWATEVMDCARVGLSYAQAPAPRTGSLGRHNRGMASPEGAASW